MGLENAGMQTVFQCEWDKHCRTILDRHWPTVPKWDDVSTLTGEHILATHLSLMLLRGVHHAKTYRSQVNGQD
jgi:site-specific DNA-cytosine methylase